MPSRVWMNGSSPNSTDRGRAVRFGALLGSTRFSISVKILCLRLQERHGLIDEGAREIRADPRDPAGIHDAVDAGALAFGAARLGRWFLVVGRVLVQRQALDRTLVDRLGAP